MADIDALLFDLGGVIVDIDFARVTQRWAKHADRDHEVVRQRFVTDDTFRGHERGSVSDAAFFASLRTSLGIELSDDQFLDGWNAIFGGVISGVPEMLATAAGHYPLYLFSNTNPAHERYWSEHYAAALKPFRALFVSSTIGLRKPDAEAFAHVAREIGAPPSRILFFDDSLANIEGARAAGFRTVHVRSSADIADSLATILPRSAPQG